MTKILAAILLFFFSIQPTYGHVLEELWNKYAPKQSAEPLPIPGRIFGAAQGTGQSAFDFPWKYRTGTFEMHFENPYDLAQSIYSLALFAHDVSPDLPSEKFYGGVLGFHYSARQIADWLNDVLAAHKSLDEKENAFAGIMLEAGVIRTGAKGFEPGKKIGHVLGAAPGKKRTFAENLRHERLHVFWDENPEMRQKANLDWQKMKDAEKDVIRKELRNYAQDNENQLIEEWAIKNAENSNMPIK